MTRKTKAARLMVLLLAFVLVLGMIPAMADAGYNGLEVANISQATGFGLSVNGTAVMLTVPYAQTTGINVAAVLTATAKPLISVNGTQYTIQLTSNGFTQSSSVPIGGSTQVTVAYKLTSVSNAAVTQTGTTAYTVYVGKSSAFTSVTKSIAVQSGSSVKSVNVYAADFGADKANGNNCTYFELTSGTTPSYLSVASGSGSYTVGSGSKVMGLTFSVNEANIAALVCNTDTAYTAKAYDINGILVGEGQLLVRVKSPDAAPIAVSINSGDMHTMQAFEYSTAVCTQINPVTVSFVNVPSTSQGTLTVGGTVAAAGTKYPLGALVFRAASSYKGSVTLTYRCYDAAGYYFINTLTIAVESDTATEITKNTVISSGFPPLSKSTQVTAAEIKAACTSRTFNMAAVYLEAVPASGISAVIGTVPVTSGAVWTDFTKNLVITPTQSGTYTMTYTATDGTSAYTGTIKVVVSNGQIEDTFKYIIYNQTGSENWNSLNSVAGAVIDKALDAMGETEAGGIYLSLLPYSIQGTLSSTYGTFYTSSGATEAAGTYRTYTADEFKNMYYVPTAEIGTADLTYIIYDETNTYCVTGKISFVNQGQTLISYTTAMNNTVFFAKEDFDIATTDALGPGYTLSSVRFTGSDTGNGDLYYAVSSTQNTLVLNTENYDRDDLDQIYFKPDNNYLGTDNTIVFTGSAYYGTNTTAPVTFTGTVSVAVLEQVDLIYQTSAGMALTFSEDDFAAFFATYFTANFQCISIDALPASGVLYENYDKISDTGTHATAGKIYYVSTLSNLALTDVLIDELTYVPAAGAYNTTISIPFTAYGPNTVQRSGVLQIRVTKGSVSSVSGSAYCTGALLSGNSLKTICDAATGGTLSYVTFKLPDSDTGTLFYNYSSATSYDSKVSGAAKYYVSSTAQNALLISKVAFVPIAGFSGAVTIGYTGYDEDGNWYIGTIKINILKKTASSAFADVSGNYSWAADAVDFLYSNEVTTGLTATAYGPGNNIKRGDFMLMLYRAFGLSRYDAYASSTANFADVTKSYYATAIRVARYLEIAKGNGTNFFPESSITREEAMALVYRTLEKVSWSLEHEGTATYNSFKDTSKVSSYAVTYLQYFVNAGVVIGTNGYLNPKQAITRAEMAVILHRVLTY